MKLLLIDGSNLIFRAYYATEKRDIKTPDGEDANAIYTLITMINKLIVEHKPTHMFIALDTGKSTFRHEKYPEYKGKRSETPDRLKNQFPMAKELYAAMGIENYATERFEADDLIASYAKIAEAKGFEVQVVSGDKDLLQLISPTIKVLTPGIGFIKECNYTAEVFKEKFGFEKERFIEYKALVGDSSDNIIGVEKIGAKTAAKFINNYPNIDAMITDAKKVVEMVENKEKIPKDAVIKGKNAERMAVSEELLHNNLELVELIEDVDVHIPLEELAFNDYNYETFIKYLKKCGFTKFVNEYSKRAGIEEEKVVYNQEKVREITKFDVKKHTGKETFIYTETLGENYHNTKGLGIGIACSKGLFYLPQTKIDQDFINYLQSDSKKIIYNTKRLMVILKTNEINGLIFDPYLALALLKPENYKKSIDLIAIQEQIDVLKDQRELYGPKSNPRMPLPDEIKEDIGLKAHICQEIYVKLVNEIEINELSHVLQDIELPLTKVLAQMEQTGIVIDQDKLHDLNHDFEIELEKIEQKIELITDINIKSPKQLREYLFETEGLPDKGIKKTKSGHSTDVENLSKLRKLLEFDSDKYAKHIELIDLIFEHRMYAKLNSTYLKGLSKYLVDSKLHPIYHQLLAETGRLSVSEPNIQNIPIRTEKGQVIRSLFTAPIGKKVVAIDYSQVELRVIAHMADEKHMLEEFKLGNDIHTETAKKILNVETVTSLERSRAKAINFGIIYGMSAFGLAKQVGISKKEANEFIDKYLQTYPNIERYMSDLISFAQDNGYVKTLDGRRRNLENINSSNRLEAENAKRMAINTPVQGTAADIIKKAMIEVNQYIKDTEIELVMQIHDELVFYIPEDKLEIEIPKLKAIMENVVDLNVNLVADAESGDNWLEAK